MKLPDGPALMLARPKECHQLAMFDPEGPFRVCRCGADDGLSQMFQNVVPTAEGGLQATGPIQLSLPPEADITDGSFPDPNSALVIGGDQVSLLDLRTQVLTPTVNLEGRTRTSALLVGSTPTLVGEAKKDAQTTYAAVELRAGAKWQTLGALPLPSAGFIRILWAGDWYFAAGVDDSTVKVWKSSHQSLVDLGNAPKVVQSALVEPTDNQPNGHVAFDCNEGQTCTLYRVDLDPPSVTRSVNVDIPTQDPVYPRQTRRLACGGVEALLSTLHHQVGAWPALEHYLLGWCPLKIHRNSSGMRWFAGQSL